MASKDHPSEGSFLDAVTKQLVDRTASFVAQAIATAVTALAGWYLSRIVPQQVLQNQPGISSVSVEQAATVAWGWGLPLFLLVAGICALLLRSGANSTVGVPHAEIQGLRRRYWLLHLGSTLLVGCILAPWLIHYVKEPSGNIPNGVWITLGAVLLTYSAVFLFAAAWVMPRSLRIAATYPLARKLLASSRF